jgi:ssDNA-binding Zn-finger/Zn-ribbon topoisomerase 1
VATNGYHEGQSCLKYVQIALHLIGIDPSGRCPDHRGKIKRKGVNMPKCEEEYWAGLKDGRNLRYCARHQHYYDASIGCHECYLGEHRPITHVDEKEEVTLLKCPKCKHKSLYFNTSLGLYECLNNDCAKVFAYTESKINKQLKKLKIQ